MRMRTMTLLLLFLFAFLPPIFQHVHQICGIAPASLIQGKIAWLPLNHLPDVQTLPYLWMPNYFRLDDGNQICHQPVQI